MMGYRAKTPWWLKLLFPSNLVWEMPAETEPSVYITFDDGPHPSATPFVLELLKEYDAKATFFCVGNNVMKYPTVYNEILTGAHSTGNHTHNHVNGWKTANATYLANIEQASEHITSRLFRPPYGKLKPSQIKELRERDADWKIIMWDVLSADFDKRITPEQCLKNVLDNIRPGSIVLFHDSEKAWDRMSYALPHVLEYCKNKGWKMGAIPA
jgi:peptidoglycan/xylan/chitin deacetylase (PgdA/CDA1 family)